MIRLVGVDVVGLVCGVGTFLFWFGLYVGSVAVCLFWLHAGWCVRFLEGWCYDMPIGSGLGVTVELRCLLGLWVGGFLGFTVVGLPGL